MRAFPFACIAAAFLAASQLGARESVPKITAPVPYEVIQREGFDPIHAHVHAVGGPALGFADVAIAAEFPGAPDGAEAEFRIVLLAKAFGHGCGWTRLEARIHRGKLAATARIPAGGWYRLEVRCAPAGKASTAAVEPFGVGEVFMVAGQSYAGGASDELLKIDDPQGRVVTYDVVQKSWRVANDPMPHVSFGGNIWPALGNDLLPLARVPIGFVDVAVGGTASREWMPGEELYENLSAAGKAIGRFRAVLWQQGESDVMGKTPAATYVANLKAIRRALAIEWGFSPPWLPAKSTLHLAAYDDPIGEQRIRDAIGELWKDPGFFPGPDTDILGGENRSRHFTGIGQRRAGLLWFAAVWDLLNRPAASIPPAEPDPRVPWKTYDIGSRKQLFIDRRFVTQDSGIALSQHSPAKIGPVLIGTKPWDSGFISAWGTVAQDGGKYRMWYVAAPVVAAGAADETVCRLCYAESQDALHWTKPELGLYDWQGSKANNVLLETTLESGGVLIDPKAAAAERYKLIARLHARGPRSPHGTAPAGTGLYLYTSADGFRWTLHSQRVFPFDPDTENMALYDNRTGKYLAYVRTWNPWRKVGVVETDDLLKPWPYTQGMPPRPSVGVGPPAAPSREVEPAFGADEEDPASLDFYTSSVVEYPWADDAYLMFPSAYRHFPEPPAGKFHNDGILDIDLAVSRTGHRFHRISRSAYIGLGTKATRDNGTLYLLLGLLRRGDDLYQYYEGNDHTHGGYHGFAEMRNRGTIFAVRQRLDGFASADAGASGGRFVTPPVVFKGRALALNMDASATGEIRVELQDMNGQPLKGFTFTDSDPLSENDLAKTATWRHGKADVSALAGTPVRVAFRMRLASLYAFQFTE